MQTHTTTTADVLHKVRHYLSAHDYRQLEATVRATPHRPRVHYVAVDRRRTPPRQMQPKVRKVYTQLAKAGPLTHTDLQARLGEDFEYNTIRYAVQILRQAGLVDSERG